MHIFVLNFLLISNLEWLTYLFNHTENQKNEKLVIILFNLESINREKLLFSVLLISNCFEIPVWFHFSEFISATTCFSKYLLSNI
jgi:hypothetical protein